MEAGAVFSPSDHGLQCAGHGFLGPAMVKVPFRRLAAAGEYLHPRQVGSGQVSSLTLSVRAETPNVAVYEILWHDHFWHVTESLP